MNQTNKLSLDTRNSDTASQLKKDRKTCRRAHSNISYRPSHWTSEQAISKTTGAYYHKHMQASLHREQSANTLPLNTNAIPSPKVTGTRQEAHHAKTPNHD